MTEQDANTLLAENPNLCVRYTQDESGQILTEVSLSQKSSRKIGSQWLFRFIASIVALVTGLVGRSASADTTHKAKTPPKQPVKTQSQPTRHLIMGKRVMPTHTMGKPVRRTPKPEEPKKPSEKTEQGKVPNSKEKSTFTTLGMISNKF